MRERLLLFFFATSLCGAGETVSTSYVPYRFDAGEGWQMRAQGDAGSSRLDGRRWIADFTRGAEWVAIAPPDRVLLGTPEKFRLRVRGAAKGHTVRVFLSTHFMTFHKAVGELAQELTIDAPPGPGWEWLEGENDGKIHGPLRVGEIRLEANGLKDRVELELVDLTVEGSVPSEKRCVLTARGFTAQMRCLSADALSGELRWKIRDWDGAEIGVGARQVAVPAGAAVNTIEIAAPRAASGAKFLETEFTLDIPGQKIAPVAACWTAQPEPHTDDKLRPESPFGMGVYLGRFEGADMERTARVAREAGVKWSREDFEWSRIEPARGRFDWAFHDNLVATAKRNGISVYAIVMGWPTWTKAYTEEGIEDWLVFLKELVRHYKNDIHQWEVWNEPNIFFWQGPRDMYATLLIKSYAAIKEADPTAQVLGISTAGIDYNFIARMLSLETPFDVLTIHPYRTEMKDRVFINELKIVSDLVRRRPVWLTEMGWSTFTPHHTIKQDFEPFTLRENAQLLARAYLCSIVSGVEPRTFWYDFRNDGEDPLYFENEMGIVYRDFSPKPSYAAYSTLARVLGGKRPAGPVGAPEGVLAYRFEGGGTVYALWNPTADAAVTLDAGPGAATIVNTIGEARRVKTENGKLTLLLKRGAPVYVLAGGR